MSDHSKKDLTALTDIPLTDSPPAPEPSLSAPEPSAPSSDDSLFPPPIADFQTDPPSDFQPEEPFHPIEESSLPDPNHESPKPELSSKEVMSAIAKTASENVAPQRSKPVPAERPYNLWIEGVLEPFERERLLSLLSSEAMGITPDDIQFQTQGKILLPRISEFAAVLVVQRLRPIHATFRMVESTDSTDTEPLTFQDTPTSPGPTPIDHGRTAHPADAIPVLTEPYIPHPTGPLVIDLLTSSAILCSEEMEATHSPEYTKIIEVLMRQLRYKAFYKGADLIKGFRTEIHHMSRMNEYRIQVYGTALKLPA